MRDTPLPTRATMRIMLLMMALGCVSCTGGAERSGTSAAATAQPADGLAPSGPVAAAVTAPAADAAARDAVAAPGGASPRSAPQTAAGPDAPVPPRQGAASSGTGGRAMAKATFASGCFWCTESDFDKVTGVISTTSGYTGGTVKNPTYEQVSAGGTGHVESVEIVFDPSVVTYAQLLDTYWHNVDPFVSRGQFCDFGEQYRPVIFVHDQAQRAEAESSMAVMQKRFDKPIVVAIETAGTFYPAEDYHQDFHNQNKVRYEYYRWGCGRDARLAEIWGKSQAR